jgi:two-component system response regulator MprA
MVRTSGGGSAARILIADDNEALRKSLLSAFEPMGFKIYLASGGSMAVTVARERPIDLAILDINMPDLSGIEALRRIRQERSSIGCIFITSEAPGTVRKRASSAGSYTLVRKPIRIERLRHTVLNLLNSREHQDSGNVSGDNTSSREDGKRIDKLFG